MPFRIGKIVVVLALVVMTGGHWAILQTVAWTTMLADNLCTQSVSAAVANTFDGQHPCCLCMAIAAAKKSEKKSEALPINLKMEFPPLAETFAFVSPGQFSAFSLADFSADSSFPQPPVPPPRAFPA